jgi:hypothetical protein
VFPNQVKAEGIPAKSQACCILLSCLSRRLRRMPSCLDIRIPFSVEARALKLTDHSFPL